MKEKIRLMKYAENPFLQTLELKKRSKQVRVSPLGKNEHILINQSTGEIQGTHVVTYKEVDESEFVKLFTRNIALTFDLTSAGIKAFNVLMYSVQTQAINKDQVFLDEKTLADFLSHFNLDKPFTMKTLYRGITELQKAQIIAKSTRYGVYFINPNFVFNGDRIAFTTTIKKRPRNKNSIAGNVDKDQIIEK